MTEHATCKDVINLCACLSRISHLTRCGMRDYNCNGQLADSNCFCVLLYKLTSWLPLFDYVLLEKRVRSCPLLSAQYHQEAQRASKHSQQGQQALRAQLFLKVSLIVKDYYVTCCVLHPSPSVLKQVLWKWQRDARYIDVDPKR